MFMNYLSICITRDKPKRRTLCRLVHNLYLAHSKATSSVIGSRWNFLFSMLIYFNFWKRWIDHLIDWLPTSPVQRCPRSAPWLYACRCWGCASGTRPRWWPWSRGWTRCGRSARAAATCPPRSRRWAPPWRRSRSSAPAPRGSRPETSPRPVVSPFVPNLTDGQDSSSLLTL